MYTFIINPNSRSGLGQHIWKKLEPTVQSQCAEYEIFFSKYQGHTTTFVQKLTSDGATHTLVILGGDGTINEVVNGIADFSKVTLGYIPTGSSNDFARGLGLPTDPHKALEHVLNPTKYRSINIGHILYGDHKKRHFAVSSGIGFDAAVCHQAVVSKLKKFLNKFQLGKLTYAGIALNQIMVSMPKSMSVVVDGFKSLKFDSVYFIAIMNQPYEGGGFKFCPDAKPDDGLLNILVVSDMPKAKIVTLLPAAYTGKHLRFKGVTTFTCKSIEINSERALPIHTDGEPVFLQRNLYATCADRTLRIITTH
ncbi:diacylglycerol/lipid kinase family protein [Lachnospiraceae bacterium LCP25S3_G4]